jgi:hypothetical protein
MQTTGLSDVSNSRQMLVMQLKSLGANLYDLSLPETHTLLHLIRPNEVLFGVVYGRYVYQNVRGRGVLAATDSRLLLINKKPLYLNYTEISYRVVSGVSWVHAGLATKVTVATRMGDINLRTFNGACARQFVEAVELMLFSQRKVGRSGSLR